jgi:hypothetical protein
MNAAARESRRRLFLPEIEFEPDSEPRPLSVRQGVCFHPRRKWGGDDRLQQTYPQSHPPVPARESQSTEIFASKGKNHVDRACRSRHVVGADKRDTRFSVYAVAGTKTSAKRLWFKGAEDAGSKGFPAESCLILSSRHSGARCAGLFNRPQRRPCRGKVR